MRTPSTQRGAALLVTLVMVALISLLAFSASQATRLQQQLATNEATRQIAFQAAEAALRSAENSIDNTSELALFCSAEAARYSITTMEELEQDVHWKSLGTSGAEADFALYDSDSNTFIPTPRYLIGCIAPELIDNYVKADPAVKGQSEEKLEQRYFFRVFSIGYGPGGRAIQRLEARYVY